jgi:hypothetical protein
MERDIMGEYVCDVGFETPIQNEFHARTIRNCTEPSEPNQHIVLSKKNKDTSQNEVVVSSSV